MEDRRTEIKTRVTGFLVPWVQETDPTTGRTRNGLTFADYERVRTGYACADCLAMFDTYTVKCPVCGLSRNLEYDLQEAPSLWNQHYAEHMSEDPVEKPPVVNPLVAIQEVSKDKDVEQVPLSKLKKRRR